MLIKQRVPEDQEAGVRISKHVSCFHEDTGQFSHRGYIQKLYNHLLAKIKRVMELYYV